MYSVHWLTNSFCQNTVTLLPNSIACKFQYSTHQTFTANFHYLQIPFLLLYRQIPLLAHSTYVTFTAKRHYLQIPTTAKNLTLPSKSNTCKFQDSRFTAKILYLHIQLLTNSYNPFHWRPCRPPAKGHKPRKWPLINNVIIFLKQNLIVFFKF